MTNSGGNPRAEQAPRFRWVHHQLDMRYELREAGHSRVFATVYTLVSSYHQPARDRGYWYSVHVAHQSGPIAFCKEIDDAKALARDLAGPVMTAENSVAWEAGRAARKATREEQTRTEQEAARAAAELAWERNKVLAEALTQYIENAADEPTQEEKHKVELAEQMLEDINILWARLAEAR